MTVHPPPEFRLLSACCHWPRDASGRAVIQHVAAGVDWTLFLRLAKYHRVTALAANGLAAAGAQPSAEIALQLKRAAGVAVRHSLAVAAETTHLQHKFDTANVPVLFLKGATLAIRAYGTLAEKSSYDIDLLVLPTHAIAALKLMNDLRYKLKPPYDRMDKTQLDHFVRFGRDLPLQSASNGLVVEVKWWPTYNRTLLCGLTAVSPSQTVAITASMAARTFKDDDLFAYLCVHGAVHRWSRLKWLADLHALLANTPPDQIAKWYRRAEETGAGLCAAQALLLCNDVFGMPVPVTCERGLHQRRPRHLAAVAFRGISNPAPDDVAADRIASTAPARIYGFLLGKGLRFQIEQFAKALVQPVDAVFFPLPKAMYGLYFALRVPFLVLRRCLGLRV